MSIQLWAKAHKRELISGGIGAALFLVIWLLVCYVPRPALVDPPTSTKESTVSLKGTATPNVSVAVFDAAGNALVIVSADDKGEFALQNIPIGEGSNVRILRAVDSGWKASFPLKITIQKDTTAPTLNVNTLDGATVTGSNTVISGSAEPGSTVTVNGVKTTVNADGSWTATVSLASGKNTITVAATDPAGNTTTNTQTIQYTPSEPDSQTGTATVTTSTSMTSPGSLPATTNTSTAETATSPSPSTGTTSPTTSPSTSPTPSPGTTTPPPQPILSITATTYVSNTAPNSHANQIIYATVKDNYGHPVTSASVTAIVRFKSGSQSYTLSSLGNGTYSVNFKLSDKFVPGYPVTVDVTARYNGLASTANTAFTPS